MRVGRLQSSRRKRWSQPYWACSSGRNTVSRPFSGYYTNRNRHRGHRLGKELRYPDNLLPRELVIGLFIPFGAAVTYGAEPIYASFGFEEGTAVPVGLVIKTVAATLGFGLYLRFRNILPRPSTIRTKNVQLFVFAGIFNTLFLLGYYVALEIVPVSVVVPLHITSSLFVIVFSYLFMPQRLEHITWKLAASAVVVGSVALIIVFRNGTV